MNEQSKIPLITVDLTLTLIISLKYSAYIHESFPTYRVCHPSNIEGKDILKTHIRA